MEQKKTEQADLEKKRGLFLQIGLVVVMGLVLLAFEWKSKPKLDNTFGERLAEEVDEEIIPITRQPETPPPPEEPDPDGEPCAEPEPPQAPVSDSPVESERTKEHKAVGLRSLLSKLKRAIKKRATKIVEIFPAKKGKAKTPKKVNGKKTGKEKK